jgi:hypothetical protein
VTAQKVTMKLTQQLINQTYRNRESRLFGTKDFLQSQLNKLATRLTDTGNQLARERATKRTANSILELDYELLVSTYKAVFAKHEDVQMMIDTEKRRGATFVIVDPANLGKAVSPNRIAFAGVGGLVGLSLGGIAIVGTNRRQRRMVALGANQPR